MAVNPEKQPLPDTLERVIDYLINDILLFEKRYNG
jgi:hypothetical protein